MTNVQVVGTFKGINKFGHARIMEHDGKIIEVMEGRMRKSDEIVQSTTDQVKDEKKQSK